MPLEQKYRPLRFPRKARKGGKKLGPFSNSGCMIPNVPTFPLIAFVHVPKTGGSTVNKLLHLCSPRGLAHVHSEPFSDAGAFLDLASDCDWLSGHFRRDEFAAKLIWLDRPVDYFASVREPSAQLVSALNWQFEILSEGIEFFLGYPLQSQAVMAEVTSTDFSNLSAVMALLLNPANTFFLNLTEPIRSRRGFCLDFGQRKGAPIESVSLHRYRGFISCTLQRFRLCRGPATGRRFPRERGLQLPFRYQNFSNARTSGLSCLSSSPRF